MLQGEEQGEMLQHRAAPEHDPVLSPHLPTTHLSQHDVELKDLPFPFHLPDADLASELSGGLAVPLQGEGAVQGSLAAAPDVIERDFLRTTKAQAQ